MADPFSVDLATLIVQADSVAAQISATPALLAAVPSADPTAARARLLDAARRADDLTVARGLAQADLDRANRRARDLIAAVTDWRRRLLLAMTVLTDMDPRWTADVGIIRAALDFRPVRFQGTRAAMTEALPVVRGRAAAMRVVCGPPPAAAQVVIDVLGLADGLVEAMDATDAALTDATARRLEAVDQLREARASLQRELRFIAHLWTMARSGAQGAAIPTLDLTWVRGAIGRRRADEEPPPADA